MKDLKACVEALDMCNDMENTLESIERYSLASYEQHLAVLQHPGLVAAIVRHITADGQQDRVQSGQSPGYQPTVTTPGGLHTEDALAAATTLTITSQGQQAFIEAGTIDAICAVLGGFQRTSQHSSKKRKTLLGASTASDIDLDVIRAALQLLARLLFDSVAARPPVGALKPASAVAAALALLHELPAAIWASLSNIEQQDAAAVLARLAMEPQVAQVLFHDASPNFKASAAAYPGSSSPATRHSPERNRAQTTSTGLAALLGNMPSRAFISFWEAAPAYCPSSQSGDQQPRPFHSIKGQQQQQNQQPNRTAQQQEQQQQHVQESGFDVGGLLRQLSADSVFSQVLPGGIHCPVMDADADDPVQFLQDLRQQAQLMMPLQLNQDFRLVKTEHGTTGTNCNEQLVTQEEGAITHSSCLAAHQAGYTLVLRDMAKRCVPVGQLVEALEQELGLPAGANLYFTPPGAQGLKPHYDDHDVFVVQLSGCKTWQLSPPQHHALPLTYQQRLQVTMPPKRTLGEADMVQKAEGQLQQLDDDDMQEPQQQQLAAMISPQQLPGPSTDQVQLQPGDVLYIARGWVHQAFTPATEQLSTEAAAVGSCQNAQSSAGTPAVGAGSSLHVSVGIQVDANSSVQGFLHFFINFCSDRSCSMCAIKTTCQRPSEQQQLQRQQQQPSLKRCTSLSIRAAALLLHVLLWQQASCCPAYRKMCPLMAKGELAALISEAVAQQLQAPCRAGLVVQGQHSAALATTAGGPTQCTDAGSEPVAWLAHALQQMLPSTSCGSCPHVSAQQQHQQHSCHSDFGNQQHSSAGALAQQLLQDINVRVLKEYIMALLQRLPGQAHTSEVGGVSADGQQQNEQESYQHDSRQQDSHQEDAAAQSPGLLELHGWLAVACQHSDACHTRKCKVLLLHAAGVLGAEGCNSTVRAQPMQEQCRGGAGMQQDPSDQQLCTGAATCGCSNAAVVAMAMAAASMDANAQHPCTAQQAHAAVDVDALAQLQEAVKGLGPAAALLSRVLRCQACYADAAATYQRSVADGVAARSAVRRAFLGLHALAMQLQQ